MQAEGAGQHAVARRLVGAVDRPAQQLGVGFGHHLGHPAHVHHGETLHAQGRQQHVVGLVRRHLAFADQGQVALDPWVHQELLAGGTGQRAHHRLDIGVDEVQLHRLIPQRIARHAGAARRALGAAAAGHRVQDFRPLRLLRLQALAVRQQIAAAPGVGQGLAQLAVHQQGRRRGGGGVAASPQRQQQKRCGLATLAHVVGT